MLSTKVLEANISAIFVVQLEFVFEWWRLLLFSSIYGARKACIKAI